MFTCADRGPKGTTKNMFVLSRTPSTDDLAERMFAKWQTKLEYADTDNLITRIQEGCIYQNAPSEVPSIECQTEATDVGTILEAENSFDNVGAAQETSKEAEHDEGQGYCAQTNDPQ